MFVGFLDSDEMGLFSILLDVAGFGFGLPLGLLLGYFLFLYRDGKPLKVTPLSQLDPSTLCSMLPDFPLWFKSPDYERVDWLNNFLSETWPYLDEAICDMIRSMEKELFNQYIGKFFIKSIEFDQLTLGSIPPTFSGIKFLETNEKEIMVETLVQWTSNCNVVVLLKCLSVEITLQLEHLHIFVAPRIILSPLTPEFPCFRNINLSLIEKPHIDFGFKLFGGDVMAIPGLYHYIQATLREQISTLYHWPEILQFPILDYSSGGLNGPVGILHVKVVQAIDLQKMDFFGKSDPYVKLILSGDRNWSHQTTVQLKTLNPIWNENFKFIVKDPQTQILQIHVFDWDKMKSPDKIGIQEIPLHILSPNERKQLTLKLLKNMNEDDHQNKRNRGKIVVEVKFNPIKEVRRLGSSSSMLEDTTQITRDVESSNGVLSVVIESAENVEGRRHNNPYALVHFRGEQRKTKRIRNNRNPRWNKSFDFMLEAPPINEKIHIGVMSTRRFLSCKESLGYVDINLTDVVANGRVNKKYYLIDSNNGRIHVEVSWRTF